MRGLKAVKLRILKRYGRLRLRVRGLRVQSGTVHPTLPDLISGRSGARRAGAVQVFCDGMAADQLHFFESYLFRALEQEIW